jgi:competence protein ComEC
MHKHSFAIILLALIFVGCQAYLLPAQSTLSPIPLTTSCPEDVTIYFLDVGQGDSILVKTASKSILIDGGPSSAGSKVVNYLNAYQVSKIDLMVATHPHADHIGGLITVLQSTIPVQDIFYNGINYTSTQTFNTWKSLALTHNLTQASRGQVYSVSPTINFTVLSPTSPSQFSDTNAESVVMRLQVGNTSVMLTGDAQLDTEQFLVSSGSILSSEILKVGHHGSSTSTSQVLLSAVNASYGVISAGIDNSYGHPTQQTLDVLSANNIITYGTYGNGTITFTLNSAPTPTPTASPSPTPTPTVSPDPTPTPTTNPTSTANPTNNPTTNPTSNPTSKPATNTPTQKPTVNPTARPTVPEISIILIIGGIIAITASTLLVRRRLKVASAYTRVTAI